MRKAGHESRNLRDAIVAVLAKSTLKNRFNLDLNLETAHWDIGFDNLSEDEFKAIFPLAFRAGPIQWDLGDSQNCRKAIRVFRLTNTRARDFARAVAKQFRVRTESPSDHPLA